MTEGVEHAIEQVAAGILFCMAIAMLLLLHETFMRQTDAIGTVQERLILSEREGV